MCVKTFGITLINIQILGLKNPGADPGGNGGNLPSQILNFPEKNF